MWPSPWDTGWCSSSPMCLSACLPISLVQRLSNYLKGSISQLCPNLYHSAVSATAARASGHRLRFWWEGCLESLDTASTGLSPKRCQISTIVCMEVSNCIVVRSPPLHVRLLNDIVRVVRYIGSNILVRLGSLIFRWFFPISIQLDHSPSGLLLPAKQAGPHDTFDFP